MQRLKTKSLGADAYYLKHFPIENSTMSNQTDGATGCVLAN